MGKFYRVCYEQVVSGVINLLADDEDDAKYKVIEMLSKKELGISKNSKPAGRGRVIEVEESHIKLG